MRLPKPPGRTNDWSEPGRLVPYIEVRDRGALLLRTGVDQLDKAFKFKTSHPNCIIMVCYYEGWSVRPGSNFDVPPVYSTKL